MPYRTFSDGEYLTGALVNDYLQEQVIAAGYASISALSAAIPSPNVGQYADVSGLGLMRFNGSSWTPAAGMAMANLYATSTQPLPSGTQTAITFSTAALNNLAGWSSGSRYTAPVAGKYIFSGGVSFVSTSAIANTRRRASWYKNGSPIIGGATFQPSIGTTGSEKVTAPTINVSLNTGDFVELYGMAEGGGTYTTSVADSGLYSAMFVTYGGPI